MRPARLESFTFIPLDIELNAPFGIASGAQLKAHNVLVRIELDDGSVGFGEAAPFPAVSGETQARVLEALAGLPVLLEGMDLARYRQVSAACQDALGGVPSALSGFEIALLDALCKRSNVSLLTFFGGAKRELLTDITVVTGTVDEATTSAQHARAQGFEQLKVKVGGRDVDEDIRRLLAISRAAPDASLLLDANCGYSAEEALALLRGVGRVKERISIFEQPTARDDFEALSRIERDGRIPVAADESLRGAHDLRQLITTGGISGVNIKTAKFGLIQAHDLLIAARAAGLLVMVGGMVESELSMSASACLAAGVGGVDFVDLDTPLFMKTRPLVGGYRQTGPLLDLSSIEQGHGVEPTEPLSTRVRSVTK